MDGTELIKKQQLFICMWVYMGFKCTSVLGLYKHNTYIVHT